MASVVPPIDGSEKAVDAQLGRGHGGAIHKAKGAERLRKEG